jgi:hypothetical protein
MVLILDPDLHILVWTLIMITLHHLVADSNLIGVHCHLGHVVTCILEVALIGVLHPIFLVLRRHHLVGQNLI